MKSWQRVDILRKSELLALEKKSKRAVTSVSQFRKPRHIAKKSRT